MNLYVDCEWNDYRGDLISMALVSGCGQEFYEVLECPSPSPWISANVMPILGKEPIERRLFIQRLQGFLSAFPTFHLVADWPEDIEHFCRMLILSPGGRIGPDRWTMEVTRLPFGAAKSKAPHNALEDARAIALYLQGSAT